MRGEVELEVCAGPEIFKMAKDRLEGRIFLEKGGQRSRFLFPSNSVDLGPVHFAHVDLRTVPF